MTIVKGSFNEIYEYSDEVLPEQIKLEEVVTGSFENITQEEIESDVVEDITFEPIDEDYDISSGEPEEEIIIIPSTNKSKSRNYREPKSDVKKNFLNRS
jgi:hypothetical protein